MLSSVSMVPEVGCWMWMNSLTANGYGCARENGATVYAHRLSYELFVGPIPSGLQIDHLCRHRWCVNPDHMEPVTQQRNLARGFSPPAINARKDRCSSGHDYTRDSRGYRVCQTCQLAYSRNYEKTKRVRPAR